MAKIESPKHFWEASRLRLAVLSVTMLAITYAIGSKAIDSGSLFDYFLTILMLFVTFQYCIKVFRFNLNGKK